VMILNLLQIGSLTKQHQLCKYLYLLNQSGNLMPSVIRKRKGIKLQALYLALLE